jgi:hypothetical protein
MSGRETVWLGRDGLADSAHVLKDCGEYLKLHTLAARNMLDLGKSPAEVFDEMVTVKMSAAGPTFEQLVMMYCTAIITLAEKEKADERPEG